MASGSYTKATPTDLLCDVCGNKTTIFRKKSKQKKQGHTKHMWCYKCKETTAHTEIGFDRLTQMQYYGEEG